MRFVEVLDGKTIAHNSRQFLLNWKASREAQQMREKSRLHLAENDMDQSSSGGKACAHVSCAAVSNANGIDSSVVSFIAPNIRSAVARARSVTLHSAAGRSRCSSTARSCLVCPIRSPFLLFTVPRTHAEPCSPSFPCAFIVVIHCLVVFSIGIDPSRFPSEHQQKRSSSSEQGAVGARGKH